MTVNLHTKRKIISGDELRRLLKMGVDKLANTVKVTMGPKGKLVLIQRKNNYPIVTKDGVTVANYINLIDEFENLGAKIIKESAARTAEEAGDGTTTATVLAQSIYNEGLKMIAAGFDIDLIKKGIQAAVISITDHINKNSQSIRGYNDLQQVALISANGETETANLIVDAIDAVGVDGHVIVEEAKGFKSSLTIVNGYQIERGYLSPYFVTDKNKMNTTYENPLIFLADKNFTSIHELMKPLEHALEQNRPILVVANEIDGDAMQGLVLNRVKGSLKIAAIKSPGFGAARHDLLDDLSKVVNAKIVPSSMNMKEFTPDMFGTCKQVIIGRTQTLFIKDETENKNVLEKVAQIKNKLNNDPSLTQDEKTLLDFRIKQLSGGIGILRVGAATESELIERYDRVDDALHATKAAIEEGILPGGGAALTKASKVLLTNIEKCDNQHVAAGIRIIMNACNAPFKQILTNAGINSDSTLNKIKNSNNKTVYDLRTNTVGDMFELGIVDPTKVVRCALENAASSASMLLSAEASMINIEENLSKN